MLVIKFLDAAESTQTRPGFSAEDRKSSSLHGREPCSHLLAITALWFRNLKGGILGCPVNALISPASVLSPVAFISCPDIGSQPSGILNSAEGATRKEGGGLSCPTDLQLDFNWVVKSNPVLFQECQDVIPVLFTGGARQSRTWKARGRDEKTWKGKESKQKKMKKVLLILKWYEEPQNAPSLLYHYQTNHYCFLSQAKLFCVQDLMGRAIYFGYNHDHKSSVQRNNNNKGKKVIFTNRIHLSNYLIAINQF